MGKSTQKITKAMKMVAAAKLRKAQENAEKATKKMAEIMGNRFDTKPARYIIIYNESWGRWIGAIDMSEMLSRKNTRGDSGFTTGFYSY